MALWEKPKTASRANPTLHRVSFVQWIHIIDLQRVAVKRLGINYIFRHLSKYLSPLFIIFVIMTCGTQTPTSDGDANVLIRSL